MENRIQELELEDSENLLAKLFEPEPLLTKQAQFEETDQEILKIQRELEGVNDGVVKVETLAKLPRKEPPGPKNRTNRVLGTLKRPRVNPKPHVQFKDGSYTLVKTKRPKSKKTPTTCLQCYETFESAALCKEHEKSHGLSERQKCEFCEFATKDLRVLRSHMEEHFNVKKQFECETCEKTFNSESVLEFHIKTHPPTQPTCGLCEESFANREDLLEHIPGHLSKAGTSCRDCAGGFSSLGELASHLKSHNGTPRPRTKFSVPNRKHWICSVCKVTFATRQSRNQHQAVHEEKYKCADCGKNLTSKGSLISHTRIHTMEKPFECEACGTAFRTKALLTDHIYRAHTPDDPQYICGECGKRFHCKNNYYMHIKIHQHCFICDFCGKTFARKAQLELHIHIHTGLKPYKCGRCDKAYHRKGVLEVHMRKHTGECPYSCPYCDKKFPYSGSLAYHVRMHTQELPFSCERCGADFKSKYSLTAHFRRVHEKKGGKFQCNYCMQNFNSVLFFRRHLIVNHRQIPNLMA